jgi:hypothetical protein
MMRRSPVTVAELIFVFLLGATGLIVSRSWFIFAMNSIPPWSNLVVWYVALTLWVYFVVVLVHVTTGQRVTIAIGPKKTRIGFIESVAFAMFTFTFFIVWNWTESDYAETILNGPPLENIFRATEDGITFLFWHNWFGLTVQTAGFLTYVITPMILALIAASLVGTKRYLQFLQMAGRG